MAEGLEEVPVEVQHDSEMISIAEEGVLMDLGVTLATQPELELPDPLIIASSHWTAKDNAFRQLAPFEPSAATLKTTSEKAGGSGVSSFSKRDKRRLEDANGRFFAQYTDGPKTEELVNIVATRQLLQDAKRILPNTLIGLSVLYGEDYQNVRDRLPMDDIGYVELNLKYTFRGIDLQDMDEAMEELLSYLSSFLAVFEGKPRLVKLPREFTALFPITDLGPFIGELAESGAGVIVANSQKIRVPPSRASRNRVQKLDDGVVVGEHLFLDTYNAIRVLVDHYCRDEGLNLPVVASGGIVDIGGIVDLMAAGSDAVQLCTVLDDRKPHIIGVMREQLSELASEHGSLGDMVATVRSDDQAWFTTCKTAREYRIDARRDIHDALFNNEEQVLSLIQETIELECSDIEAPEGSPPSDEELPQELRFIYTMGNVSSYLMCRHLHHESLVRGQRLKTARKFVNKLGDDGFHWDLAVIGESALVNIQKENREDIGDRWPIEVAEICRSRTEMVVGADIELTEVEKVYHFLGHSALTAVGELFGAEGVDAEMDDLSGPELLPLLRCWRPAYAILAKPPLSRMYGMLCRDEVKKNWAPVWHHDEPKLLVASERFLEKNGGEELAACAAWKLFSLRGSMLQNTERWAHRACAQGVLDYCEELIKGSPA